MRPAAGKRRLARLTIRVRNICREPSRYTGTAGHLCADATRPRPRAATHDATFRNRQDIWNRNAIDRAINARRCDDPDGFIGVFSKWISMAPPPPR
jgi:hypothetical protein